MVKLGMMTHVLRYLLIHGDRKKKVELEVAQGVENIEVETLRHRARQLFGLHAVLLQIWDKGFEDWVDLDDGDATPTNSRIKVEIDKNAKVTPVAHHQQTSAAVVPVAESAGRHAAPSKTLEEVSQHRPLIVSGLPQVHTLSSCPSVSASGGQTLQPIISAVQQLHTSHKPHPPQLPSSAQEPYLIDDTPEVAKSVPMHSASKQVTTSSATVHHCHGPQGGGYHEVLHPNTSSEQIIKSLLQTAGSPIRTKPTHNPKSQSKSCPTISKNVSLSNDSSHKPSVTGAWIQEDKPLAEDWGQGHVLDQEASASDSSDSSLASFLVKRRDSRWIYSYKFPEFPQGTAAKLRAGLTLTNGERSHLLDCIYKSVTPHTFYPTAYEYRCLTEMFLDLFPELCEQAREYKSRENQIDVWKQRLMHKFKNNRKRQDKNIPVVRLHKRIRMNFEPSSPIEHGYEVINLEEVDEEEDTDVTDEVAKEQGVVIKQEYSDLDEVYHVMPADTTEFSETGT